MYAAVTIFRLLYLQYADLVNGLADQGVFQRGRAPGQGQGANSASSSSNAPQSAAGKLELRLA